MVKLQAQIEEIRDRLADRSAERRYAALKEVAGPDVVAALRERLLTICRGDGWGPNRSEAARALAFLWPDPEVQDAYRLCLDAEPYVANTVVELLGARLDGAARTLLSESYQRAQNAKTRYSILQAFCTTSLAVTVDFVRSVASHRDEDERVRALSLSLLSRSNDPALKDVFVAGLTDGSQRVRATAIEALSAICGPEELLRLLPPYLEDANNRVRANAIVALLRTGYRVAEAALREMVHHTSQLFRSSAAWVLGELGPDAPVVLELDSLAQDRDPVVRERARASAQRLALRLSLADISRSSQPVGA
ncbi:MAG: HEAT repeat domain-containing protein [Candidatus Riflebacteria bacterium]|nr:HEAT repeat domain-containing protein [Candidatus Riflebacteria bacterium]